MITLTGGQLKQALEFLAPDGTPEQLLSDVTIDWIQDGHSGPGYYAHLTEEPGEGSIILDLIFEQP